MTTHTTTTRGKRARPQAALASWDRQRSSQELHQFMARRLGILAARQR